MDGCSFSFETILHISPSSFRSFFLSISFRIIRTFSEQRYSFISSFEYHGTDVCKWKNGCTWIFIQFETFSLSPSSYPFLSFDIIFFLQNQRYLRTYTRVYRNGANDESNILARTFISGEEKIGNCLTRKLVWINSIERNIYQRVIRIETRVISIIFFLNVY